MMAFDATSRPLHDIRDVEALLVTDPDRYERLLSMFWTLLGNRIISAEHAIERAEAGERPARLAIEDPGFDPLFRVALAEVRNVRRRRDAVREDHNLVAAGLLAASRLRDSVAA